MKTKSRGLSASSQLGSHRPGSHRGSEAQESTLSDGLLAPVQSRACSSLCFFPAPTFFTLMF